MAEANVLLSNLALALSKSKDIAQSKNKLTDALMVGGMNEVGVLELESTEQAEKTKTMLSNLVKEVSKKANEITRLRLSKEEEIDDFVAREDMDEIEAFALAEKEAMELKEDIQSYLTQVDEWWEAQKEEEQSSDQSLFSLDAEEVESPDTDTDFEAEPISKAGVKKGDHDYGTKRIKDKPQCDSCGKIYSNKQSLKLHIEHHCKEKREKRRVSCHGCQASFTNAINLKQHMRRGCKGKEKTKVCPKCSHSFSKASNMRAHLKKGCDGEKKRKGNSMICEKCGKSFSTSGNMRRHRPLCQGIDDLPCQRQHNHSLLDRKFDSFDEAVEYVKFLGLDEDFRQDGTAYHYQHYRCSRHGLYQPKEGHTTKKNLKCDAKFSITTDKNGVATLSGCIVHDHIIQERHLRIPATKKIELIAQLREHSYMRFESDTPK